MRSLANGESFFQQNIEATGGDGKCLLSPNLPGAMRVLEVGERQYMLSDGAFVAASSGIDLRVRTQNVGNALFGQSGGFFVTESTGQGQLVVSGFGALHEVEVEPGREVVIDNAHVVAWDSALRYELAVATRASGGLLGNLVNSVTSGEGMVLRFSGRGKVLICSRNDLSPRICAPFNAPMAFFLAVVLFAGHRFFYCSISIPPLYRACASMGASSDLLRCAA
jgi:uncharacterized protein (AIM24 family)